METFKFSAMCKCSEEKLKLMLVLAPYFASLIKELNDVFQSAAWCTLGGSSKVLFPIKFSFHVAGRFTCGLVQFNFQMHLETFLIRSGKIGRSSKSSFNLQQPVPLSCYLTNLLHVPIDGLDASFLMLTVDLRAEHTGSGLLFHSRFIYRIPKDLETPWFNNNIIEHLISKAKCWRT